MNDTQQTSDLSKIILSIYLTSSLCTFIECLFAVYISWKHVQLRKKPSKYFSYSLVLSVGLLSGISLVYAAILLCIPSANHVSRSGCFVKVIQRCLSTVSCLSLSCLALDRYMSICWPLRYFNLVTKVRCGVLSVMGWVSGFVLPIIPCATQLRTFCGDGESNITFLASYTVVYNLGAISMFVFYILVSREFRHHPKPNNHQNDNLAEMVSLVRLKTARSTLRVLVLYSILSLPHMILPVAQRLFGWYVPRGLYHTCHLLHRLHLLLFLPMYVWANADSHEALTSSVREIWKKISCFSHIAIPSCVRNFFNYMYECLCCPPPAQNAPLRLDEEEPSQISYLMNGNSRKNSLNEQEQKDSSL